MAPGRAPAAELAGLLAMLRRAGAVSECVVEGTSMGRAIPDGAVVRIRFDGARDAKPGDVVAIWLAGESLAVHRLVARGRTPWSRRHAITLGDGNLFPETPLPLGAIIGSVVGVREPGAPWGAVPAIEARGGVARLLSGVGTGAVRLATDVHPMVGQAVKGLIVALVWIAPSRGRSDGGRRPASARLRATALDDA